MRLETLFRRTDYIILKVTRGCNLRCTYCCADAVSARAPLIPMELAKRATDLLIRYSEARHLAINLHGGEPLLASDDWIAELVTYANDLASKNSKTVSFPVVTNGTLLNQNRLKRLSALGLTFSISCDGPPPLHDLYRQRGKAVEQTLDLFAELRIPFGVMTVVHRGNWDKMYEVMEWMRAHQVSVMKSKFVIDVGRAHSEMLTAQQMYQSRVAIMSHMNDSGCAVRDVELALVVKWAVRGRRWMEELGCYSTRCPAGRSVLGIEADGTITACDSPDTPETAIGRLSSDVDDDVYRSVISHFDDTDYAISKCFSCPARRTCARACTFSAKAAPGFREQFCDYTRLLADYLVAHPAELQNLYGLLEVAETSPGDQNLTRPPGAVAFGDGLSMRGEYL